MAMLSEKNLNGSQSIAGHLAIARPQVDGWGASAVISAGIDPRGKKKIEMPLESHCTDANHISRDLASRWSEKLTGVNTTTDAIETCSESHVGIRSDATTLVGSGADSTVCATDESSADGQCFRI